MTTRRTTRRGVFLGGLLFFLLFLFFAVLFSTLFVFPRRVAFGVTYSPYHARYLGLDADRTFVSMLDDLGVRLIRLPIYWNQVETKEGEYSWAETDFFMDEAAKRGGKVTLVLGQKVPRWPECHIPPWAEDIVGTPAYRTHLLEFVIAAARRYKDHPALLRYQVENEPLFPFGLCPPPDLDLLAWEVAAVRGEDPAHPILLTVSGEQEAWLDLAHMGDVLGVSLYRVVWNPAIGPVVYPHPPAWYALEGLMVRPWVREVIISELQAEPWFDGGIIPEDLRDSYAAFPVERFRDHVAFAKRTGFSEVYFWGVEWWYYLKSRGDTRLYDAARQIFLNPL